MPETDLDRAFTALTDDVATRAGRPGAASAIRTARRRRRTTLAAVVATAAIAVGSAVALPQLTDARPGWTDSGLPASAPLDAAALDAATDGWVSGWTDSPASNSLSGLDCEENQTDLPSTNDVGWSHFSGGEGAVATAVLLNYQAREVAAEAWERAGLDAEGCGLVTGVESDDYPDGTEVRHFVATGQQVDGSSGVTDLWFARTGASMGMLRTFSAGGADEESARRLSDALVAGLRSGWTQDRVGDPALEGEGQESLDLPDVDHARLESALRGWRAAGPQDATSDPPVPCLPLNETSANVSTASTSQTGLYSAIEGYRNGGVAADEVRRKLEGLRRCQSVRMVERSLGGGVTLIVWDRGGQAGHGAVWLAADEDVTVLVAADGRGTSVPLTAAREVAELVREVLASGSGSG